MVRVSINTTEFILWSCWKCVSLPSVAKTLQKQWECWGLLLPWGGATLKHNKHELHVRTGKKCTEDSTDLCPSQQKPVCPLSDLDMSRRCLVAPCSSSRSESLDDTTSHYMLFAPVSHITHSHTDTDLLEKTQTTANKFTQSAMNKQDDSSTNKVTMILLYHW